MPFENDLDAPKNCLIRHVLGHAKFSRVTPRTPESGTHSPPASKPSANTSHVQHIINLGITQRCTTLRSLTQDDFEFELLPVLDRDGYENDWLSMLFKDQCLSWPREVKIRQS